MPKLNGVKVRTEVKESEVKVAHTPTHTHTHTHTHTASSTPTQDIILLYLCRGTAPLCQTHEIESIMIIN